MIKGTCGIVLGSREPGTVVDEHRQLGGRHLVGSQGAAGSSAIFRAAGLTTAAAATATAASRTMGTIVVDDFIAKGFLCLYQLRFLYLL